MGFCELSWKLAHVLKHDTLLEIRKVITSPLLNGAIIETCMECIESSGPQSRGNMKSVIFAEIRHMWASAWTTVQFELLWINEAKLLWWALLTVICALTRTASLGFITHRNLTDHLAESGSNGGVSPIICIRLAVRVMLLWRLRGLQRLRRRRHG